LAADLLTLLNVLYPSCLCVGQLQLDSSVSRLVPIAQKCIRNNESMYTLEQMDIDIPAKEAVRKFWEPFARADRRHSAWYNGLSDILVEVLRHDGSHNINDHKARVFRTLLNNAVRSVWYVHSVDGVCRPGRDSVLNGVSCCMLCTCSNVRCARVKVFCCS
jgi:hypothetical protein